MGRIILSPGQKARSVPKLSLVTGSAKGLGLALVEKLASKGGTVIAIDRNPEALDRVAQKYPDRIKTLCVDLANLDQLPQMIDDIKKIAHPLGSINLAVMNAGISATGRFEKIPDKIHKAVFDINCVSPIRTAAALVGTDLMARGSALIFISSLSHQIGYPGGASYAASKDAVAVYAKSVRKAWAKKNIHAMAVFPGPMDTKMAAMHSPTKNTKANRAAPDGVADSILKAAQRGSHVLYPGLSASLIGVSGQLLPRLMTAMMRKILFEKMDKETY